uniref:Uncharacterized protein n=1 Tax=Candidatus Kentrum eta TaxID=2126337 RepID=A0A450VBE5_9GAMM|nr:MAG: hypothetical protein BECKH772B_GA0070898_102595 [Candidatus Kentron sp. H]VFK02109.1 MAG: hypothetical protein BECKH772A_GA0070896_102542 [Candidatus Kentron sp. H]VFK05252.1 MAG: hypothetical protein BECKH772C_GA0070978_102522 [Candidatus Kentron sp. H]
MTTDQPYDWPIAAAARRIHGKESDELYDGTWDLGIESKNRCLDFRNRSVNFSNRPVDSGIRGVENRIRNVDFIIRGVDDYFRSVNVESPWDDFRNPRVNSENRRIDFPLRNDRFDSGGDGKITVRGLPNSQDRTLWKRKFPGPEGGGARGIDAASPSSAGMASARAASSTPSASWPIA